MFGESIVSLRVRLLVRCRTGDYWTKLGVGDVVSDSAPSAARQQSKSAGLVLGSSHFLVRYLVWYTRGAVHDRDAFVS